MRRLDEGMWKREEEERVEEMRQNKEREEDKVKGTRSQNKENIVEEEKIPKLEIHLFICWTFVVGFLDL